jgi:hypothetical protein
LILKRFTDCSKRNPPRRDSHPFCALSNQTLFHEWRFTQASTATFSLSQFCRSLATRFRNSLSFTTLFPQFVPSFASHFEVAYSILFPCPDIAPSPPHVTLFPLAPGAAHGGWRVLKTGNSYWNPNPNEDSQVYLRCRIRTL